MAKKNPINPNSQANSVDEAIIDTMGVNMPNLIAEYTRSRLHREQYSRDFILLDNLVDGVPLVKEEGTPFVGDTTLPGLVRSIPRHSLKQLPTLSTRVNGAKNSIPAIICNYLLKKTAFNEDTFGKGLLSTLQMGAEQALTHGYAPFMVGTGLMFNDFGTTMRLLHYTDNSLEPGVADSNESGYFFMTTHLTPGRIKNIQNSAKNTPNTTWNLSSLKALLEVTPSATEYDRYESDPRKHQTGENVGLTYEIHTRYESGRYAKHITFCKDFPDAPLRVVKSKSKFGYPKILYLVIDPAPIHPFGISRVRLASPNQNLMNIYYANIGAMLLINSNPPLLKKGTFLKPTNLKRGAVWESEDTSASIDYKNMDNGALEQFVPMAQQFAGQIQNIMGGQSATAGPASKSAGLGKTAPGVEASQDLLGTESTQITKILENFLRQYALVALDTLLSEQVGTANLIVDDDTMNSINNIAPGTIGDDHKIEMNWEKFYESIEQWSVDIDVSLSPDDMKDKKRADLQDMLVVYAQNANTIPNASQRIEQITNMLLQDDIPLLADNSSTSSGAGQAPPATPGGPSLGAPSSPPGGAPQGAPSEGPRITETADLVKMFGMVTDPDVKNAILGMLGLPPEKTPPIIPQPIPQGMPAQPEPAPTPPPQGQPTPPSSPIVTSGPVIVHHTGANK